MIAPATGMQEYRTDLGMAKTFVTSSANIVIGYVTRSFLMRNNISHNSKHLSNFLGRKSHHGALPVLQKMARPGYLKSENSIDRRIGQSARSVTSKGRLWPSAPRDGFESCGIFFRSA